MKINIAIAMLTLCTAVACFTGCGKDEGASPPNGSNTPAPLDAIAEQALEAAEAKQNAEARRTAVNAKAKQQAAADEEKYRVQNLISQAKNLVGQTNYSEAMKLINELSKSSLSPDQQTVVDGLKKTATTQMSEAASDKAAAGTFQILGDALEGKK